MAEIRKPRSKIRRKSEIRRLKCEVRSAKSEVFSGASKVVKNDPYELRFAFPSGTNFVAKRAVARTGLSFQRS